MKLNFVMLLALTTLVGRTSGACTPNHYELGMTEMPTAMFDIEVRRILGVPEPPKYEPSGDFDSGRSRSSDSDPRDHTRRADEADLANALQGKPGAEDLVQRYRSMRADLTNHMSQYLRELRNVYRQDEVKHPAPLDLTPYKDTLVQLPEEFARYFRGAVAYDAGDWDTAIAHFASVLELPAEKRHYRSTWAVFMLGKTWTQKDPKQAGPFFEKLRSLAAEGFSDSLNLAPDSIGWQSQALMLSGDHVGAIHQYSKDPVEAPQSLRIVCRKALSQEPVDQALVQDDLSRRIVTAWVIAHTSFEKERDRWLTALDTFQPEGPVPGAEYLAWVSYSGGKMDAAARWLVHSDPATPYAQWVQAKLLLREGKLQKAAQALKQLAATVPVEPAWKIHDPHTGDMWATMPVQPVVYENLGGVLLQCGDYSGALDAVLKDDDPGDALHISERVLTADELKTFVDSRPDDEANEEVRWILARRFVREGNWEKALPYYPDYRVNHWGKMVTYYPDYPEDVRKRASEAKAHLDAANDLKQPARSRGEHYLSLGRIIRESGPALICPELEPDFQYVKEVDRPAPLSERLADLDRRNLESQRAYPKMNYFVWIAADYMWQAAQLLPDNDPMCAEALFRGGSYLKYRDPKEADRFYKALVRRNPNLVIAQQAKERRWFPKEFTPAIAYHPRTPDPWYGRKLYVAYAALALGVPAILAAYLWWSRRQRVHPLPPETPAAEDPL